jgi:hypothetical protein
MNRLAALAVLCMAFAGCGSAAYDSGSGTSAQRGSSSPRVRCLSDPARDDASGNRPLFYLFCAESP